MFWKIALTAAVVLLLTGRTAALNNPLFRLLLPRGWSSRLIALAPRVGTVGRPSEPTAPAEPRRPLLDRRVRLALLVLGLLALSGWIATQFLVVRDAPIGPSDRSNASPVPDPQ